MKKFEYKILNLSEVAVRQQKDKKVNLLIIMNEHGREGWEIVLMIKDQSFLMKRELD